MSELSDLYEICVYFYMTARWIWRLSYPWKQSHGNKNDRPSWFSPYILLPWQWNHYPSGFIIIPQLVSWGPLSTPWQKKKNLFEKSVTTPDKEWIRMWIIEMAVDLWLGIREIVPQKCRSDRMGGVKFRGGSENK